MEMPVLRYGVLQCRFSGKSHCGGRVREPGPGAGFDLPDSPENCHVVFRHFCVFGNQGCESAGEKGADSSVYHRLLPRYFPDVDTASAAGNGTDDDQFTGKLQYCHVHDGSRNDSGGSEAAGDGGSDGNSLFCGPADSDSRAGMDSLYPAGTGSMVTGVSVLLAAMPAGATTSILAAKYDADPGFATKMIIMSTLASVFTTPVWSFLLG